MRTVVHPRVAPRSSSARASSWWGRAWVRAVEEASYSSGDLLVARRMSRAGQVGQIMIEPGRFVASVEDARGLWTVAGAVPELDGSAADAFVETVAAEAGRIGALLSGDLPHTMVEHAEEAGALAACDARGIGALRRRQLFADHHPDQLLAVADVGGAAGGDDAAVAQHGHPVAEVEDLVETVGDEDRRATFADQLAVPRARGGLDLGTGPVSGCLLVVFVVLVGLLALRARRERTLRRNGAA